MQAAVADWYRSRPCTAHVQRETALIRLGKPGPIARSIGSTGNLRPDVLVWCYHERPREVYHLTVVECKAGTACRRDVQQLWTYMQCIAEIESMEPWEVLGVLVAPNLCDRVAYLPNGVTFRPLSWEQIR